MPTFAPKYGKEPLLDYPAFIVFAGMAAMFVLTYLIAARYFPIMSWWGTSKERTRTAERQMGNATVTVMVEDPRCGRRRRTPPTVVGQPLPPLRQGREGR